MSEWPDPGGPYDVDEAVYHADRTALSSTGARTLAMYCPEKFAHDRDHGRADKPHFDEGRAAHAEVLGAGAPLYVPVSDELDDDGNPIPYAEWRTNDAKEQVAQARARGETPVKPDVAARVKAMSAKLRQHPIAGPLLARPGNAEQTFVARDPDTNVLCKIRVDFMPSDIPPGGRLILVDYKGTTCAEPAAFERRMADLGYDQQGDFYRAVLTWRYQLEVPPVFVLVAQEKDPPHLVTVVQPKDYVLDGAAELNREALAMYAHCTATGWWPGYGDDVHYADVPGWRTAQYDAAENRRLARDRHAAELIGAIA